MLQSGQRRRHSGRRGGKGGGGTLAALWLHVGGHRTGSTSVQQTFAASRPVLRAAGLVYPDDVAGAPGAAPSIAQHHLVGMERAELTRHLAAIVARHGAVETVISAEGFENVEDRAAVVGGCADVFGDVRVIYYVRDPVAVAISRAARRIKAGQATYAEVCAQPPIPALRANVEGWQAAAGDRLVLRPYDRTRLVNGDVVDDILALMGRDAAAMPLIRRERNRSISLPHALELSRRIEARRRTANPAPWRRPADAGAGPPFTLPRATIKAVEAATAADVAWLASAGIQFAPTPRIALEDVDAARPTPLARARDALRALAGRGR